MNITLRKAENIEIRVTAPPSKSYTHRALIAAGLAAGGSIIERPLRADDTRITASVLRQMGAAVAWGDECITIQGTDGAPRCDPGTVLDMGDSGTSLRLLTTAALLCPEPVVVTGSTRMKERPVEGLVTALNRIGAAITYLEKEGFPPILVDGVFRGGRVLVESTVSSQFASSLLLSAPYAASALDLVIPPRAVSRSYLDVTVDVMQSFGAMVARDGYERFSVDPAAKYTGRTYRVEGDYSSASYFFAMAAVCGGRATVSSLSPSSVQGDRQFLTALSAMGCRVSAGDDAVTVASDGRLEGIEMDLSSAPDMVQTVCMVAACARSPSRFTGIGHLHYKESDRVLAIVRMLRALGGDVSATADGSITIRPARLHGGSVDPANDHRTAMSAAVLGLAVGGITVRDAGCVSKSFPEFWEILHREGLV